MSVGQMREFDIQTGNWSGYVERIEMYFLVNKVTDELKLPTLISVMGENAYELLSTLASPSKPSALTYKMAVELLSTHLQPKPSELAERFKFRQRRQLANESIAEYVTELKKLSKHCAFSTNLDENMRDQLVCGIKSETIRQRLFAEDNLTYDRVVRLALSLEAAERDAMAVELGSEKAEGLHKLNFSECSRCGDKRHAANECGYKDYMCSGCQQIGHLRRMCPKVRSRDVDYNQARRGEPAETAGSYNNNFARGSTRGSAAGRGAGRRARRGARGGARGGRARAAFYSLEKQDEPCLDDDDKDDSEDFEEEPMYQMSLSKYKPVCITVKVHDCALDMEVDTGSAISCVSKQVYDDLFSDLYLNPCALNLKFYDGSIVKPLGYIETLVEYKGVAKLLDLYVIMKGSTNLLGRQWLSELNIPIRIPKLIEQCNNCSVDCTSDKKKIIDDIISRHEALFDGTLGKYTGGCAELCVREGAQPIFCRARPLPYALRARVDAELDAMLSAGVIEPVDRSDWATPLVVVRKADGGLRICADYKVTLNRVLAVDRFPVPRMDDLFSDLSGNKFFTKLDLSQAYNQILLSECSKDFTVINTHRGLFKYARLVYGLSSSPGIFQKIMVNLFKNMPSVVVFYDDILIKSRDLGSHLRAIKQVLQTLQEHGLKINKSKCEFLTNEVKYLGFIVNEEGVRVDPDKVKAITTMPHPNNVTELKSFLGMVNFYGKFVENLSSHLAPLYNLLKKGRHWRWGMEQDLAFTRVKNFLGDTNTLAHFDMAAESVLTVDASAHGLGAVLAQRSAGGRGDNASAANEHVVAYASRSLTTCERRYSQIDKEALAIIFAVEKFHQYLYGRKFVLRTDHKPLVSIFGPNIGIPTAAASRLQRWAIKLSAYDFNIEYVRTDKNIADVLSRLIQAQKNEVVSEKDCLPEQTYLHFSTEALLLDYNVLKKETRGDSILSRVLSYISDGWPADVEIRELKPYFNRKNELYTELGCIMWGHRVVIPEACRQRVISELHDCHMGIVKTKALARSYVWWPGIDEAVEQECRACEVCAAVADAPPKQAPHSWPWPTRPWSRLHLDLLGPVAGMTYLVLVDSCSKWIEAIRMARTTAQAMIPVLRDLWAKFGLPKQIVSDNGPPFSSSEFKVFLKHNGIEQIFSAPYHPASNGAAENAVKTCKRVIKKAMKQNLDPDVALSRFLLAYRNTEHSTTGESPSNILQGRKLRMRLDNLRPDRESRVTARQERSEQAAGGARRLLQTGSQVWYREYSGNKYTDKWLPGTIAKKLGDTDYSVRSSFGTEIHRHVDQLRQRVIKNGGDASLRARVMADSILNHKSRKSLALPMAGNDEPGQGGGTSGESSESRSSLSKEVVAPASPPVALNVPAVSGDKNVVVSPVRRFPLRERKPPVRYGFEID